MLFSSMQIELMSYTKNGLELCASAAYTSHKKKRTPEIIKDLDEKTVNDFIKRIIKWGHFSVLEHASFTFGISGISRACSHQLVRHRIASFTQQSQRYVRFKKNEIAYVIPKKIIEKNMLDEYKQMMDKISDTYQKFLDAGIPPEDARYILPNAAHTNIIMTMNARELRHFFDLRCHPTAQWEIREMALRMLNICYKIMPPVFEDQYKKWEQEIKEIENNA